MNDGALNVEADARLVGWVPKSEYKGDSERWMPAEDFLKRAEEQLPLARANNRALRETNAQLTNRLKEMDEKLKGFEEAIESLKEFHSEDKKRAVARARDALKAELKSAHAAGDMDAVVEITDRLSQGDQQVKEEKAAPKPTEGDKLDSAFVTWRDANPWFESDKKRRGVAVGIAEDLRADPANNDLRGRAFYDKVKELTEDFFSAREAPKVDKTEGGGGGSGGSSSGPRGKGYAQLPTEAKQACDSMSKRYVGKGYKTVDDWRAYYAKVYFENEE